MCYYAKLQCRKARDDFKTNICPDIMRNTSEFRIIFDDDDDDDRDRDRDHSDVDLFTREVTRYIQLYII